MTALCTNQVRRPTCIVFVNFVEKAYARAAKRIIMKKNPARRLQNAILSLEKGKPTAPRRRFNWMFYVYFLRSAIYARTNLEHSPDARLFPCASTPTSDFIPREKWSNKITESTRQQQTPLNQLSVSSPPLSAFSRSPPRRYPSLPLILVAPALAPSHPLLAFQP